MAEWLRRLTPNLLDGILVYIMKLSWLYEANQYYISLFTKVWNADWSFCMRESGRTLINSDDCGSLINQPTEEIVEIVLLQNISKQRLMYTRTTAISQR